MERVEREVRKPGEQASALMGERRPLWRPCVKRPRARRPHARARLRSCWVPFSSGGLGLPAKQALPSISSSSVADARQSETVERREAALSPADRAPSSDCVTEACHLHRAQQCSAVLSFPQRQQAFVSQSLLDASQS